MNPLTLVGATWARVRTATASTLGAVAVAPRRLLAACLLVVAALVCIGPAFESGPPTPAQNLIAFTDWNGDQFCEICSDVFTMSPDGSGRRQLTHDGRSGKPRWSPDGRYLLYEHATRIRVVSGEPVRDIWLMQSDGSHPRRLVGGPADDRAPAWGPDGESFAFVRGGERSQLFVYTLRTERVRRLTSPSTWRFTDSPSWSPDGRWIAFSGFRSRDFHDSSDLFATRPDGTAVRRLTSTASRDEFESDWSPDGGHLAYLRFDQNGDAEIMVADNSGRHPKLLGYLGDSPSWSPDGRRIVTSGLTILWADGSRHRTLDPGRAPDWSPG